MPKAIDIDALLRATIDMLAERGYDGLATQEVARRAGINEATIYRRFGTKAALVETAVTHVLSMAPFAELTVSEDLPADLFAMIEAFRATSRTFGGAVITLLIEASRHGELRAAMEPLRTNLGRAVAVLQFHQEHGRLVKGNPWLHLPFLLGPFVLGDLWARTGSDMPVVPDTMAVVTAYLDGHRAHG